MNAEFDNAKSVVFDFNDTDTPPGLTVEPAPTALVVRMLREYLASEAALTRRSDLAQLEQGCRSLYDQCVSAKDPRGAAYYLGNLAVIARVQGASRKAHQLASEAEGLASQAGVVDLAARMQALRQLGNGE